MLDRILHSLSEILPDGNIIGEPFWTLMEQDKSSEKGVNGTYIAVNKNVIPLFISKKMAIEASKRLGGVVRGVSQPHLKYLVGLAENGKKFGNMSLCIILLEETEALEVEPRFIKDYFILDSK